MRAARWLGARQIELVDAPDPEPRPDQALVEVTYTGLCGSDAEEFASGPIVAKAPLILGHEIVGRVRSAAQDGTGPAVGTNVVVDVVTGCGSCFWCLQHQEGLCPQLVVTGMDVDGGLAELVAARADRLVVVPPGLDPRRAALAEPLAVAVRAVRKVGVVEDMGVLILGGGTIGMLIAQLALAEGASTVVVVEPAPQRRALLDSWGAYTVWAEASADRQVQIETCFAERGVDVVMECSGRPGLAAEAIRLVRAAGQVVLLGVQPDLEPIDVLDLVLKEKVVRGSAAHMWDDDVQVAVAALAAGDVEVESMITHVVDLEDIEDAFELLSGRGSSAIKILVRIGSYC